jgi:hypothetical protein
VAQKKNGVLFGRHTEALGLAGLEDKGMWSQQRVKRWTNEDSEGKTLNVELTASRLGGKSA